MHPQSDGTEANLQALVRAEALVEALAEVPAQEAQTNARERVPKALALALAQADARAQAQARALVLVPPTRVWTREALVPARVPTEKQAWEWRAQARARVHTVTYGDVLADRKLMDIIYSIEPRYRHSLARDLRPSYVWFTQVIVPITRLPLELLQEILLIIIDKASHSPLLLMQASKLWYTIVASMWASLKLGTTTPKAAITRKLERSPWLLDVLVDTEVDRDHLTFLSEGAYQAIFAAIEACSRWRTFVVETFPGKADLPEPFVNRCLRRCSDLVMSRLKTFRIKCPCEMSPLLERLLRILGTTSFGELTTVEINSPSVISFLANSYPSIFRSVKVLYLDTPGMPNPVDLLPHLRQLEALTASHISFPIYRNDFNIPFVHTLRHLTLRAVSIQWMSGRTFHVLESCTILFPLHRPVLQTFRTTLPRCKHLTFRGYPLDILHGVSAHNLIQLFVMSSCSDKPRGGPPLVRFSSQALQESRLVPRILHISIEAMSWAWIKAFDFMSNLEELVIESAQPSSLGVKVLQLLVVHPAHANNSGTTTRGRGNTPVCPSLKRFGLRYRRWLRPGEHFDLIPEMVSIIWSRQRSKFSLQSFHIWKGSEQNDPLELIEGSWINLKAFEHLANDGAIEGENWFQLVVSRLVANQFKPCPLVHAPKCN
jgi:hypothetical protein